MWSEYRQLFCSFLLLIVGSLAVDEPNLDMQRIINSTETTIEEYPFTVSIQWYKYHLCGGVIISPDYVLTSARCIETFTPDELKILAGSTERNNYDTPAQEVEFEEIIVHEDYNSTTWQNDIAILVLKVPFVLGVNVKVIEFYEEMDPVASYVWLTGTGWGVLETGASSYPIELHAKAMLTSDFNLCYDIYDTIDRLIDPQSMICVQCHDVENNSYVYGCTCDGDWGGPLFTSITEQNLEMKLVGLASWGYGCNKEYPHIFTNLQGKSSWELFTYTRTWTTRTWTTTRLATRVAWSAAHRLAGVPTHPRYRCVEVVLARLKARIALHAGGHATTSTSAATGFITASTTATHVSRVVDRLINLTNNLD